MTKRLRRLLATLFALTLLASACGGGDDDDDEEADASESTDAGDAEGAITDVQDVKGAVIQIVATGTFAEPTGTFAAYEEFEGVGSGSGFIIDESGIAVTNNHVVTGAAKLEVFVGGSEESVSATVLGVSECSDLAVID